MNDKYGEASAKRRGFFSSQRMEKKFRKRRQDVVDDAELVEKTARDLIRDRFYTEHEFGAYSLTDISKTRIWLWPAIVAAVIFEAYINYGSFLELFRVPGWAIAFAGLTGVMVCMAAEQHGKLMRQKTRVQVLGPWFAANRDPGINIPSVSRAYFWVITAFAVTALIGIVYARYGVLYEQHVDSGYTTEYWGKVGVAALLNILAWVIGAAASYAAHSEGIHAGAMKKFASAVEKMDRSERQYKKLRDKVETNLNDRGRKDFKEAWQELDEKYEEWLQSAREAIGEVKDHAADLLGRGGVK